MAEPKVKIESPKKEKPPKYILGPEQQRNIEESYDLAGAELGRGTYGRVISAKLKGSTQQKAIKIIPKSRVSNVERFKTEIEIMKKLDHPNIVRLYESFEDEMNVYLVLEVCEGGELFDRIIAKKYYDELGARCIFRQIIKGILYCHSKGVCHRDLKPENFLFQSKDDASILKLIDFGLSKNFIEGGNADGPEPDSPLKIRRQRQQKNNMKTRAGTPFYIAPEVLTGNYNEKCDVWSAGVIMYILLCGYPPFYGETNKEILEQVKKGKLDFTGPEWKGKSNACFDLMKRMVCKHEDRLTAEEVLRHPWMLIQDDLAPVDKDIMKNMFKNIENYAKMNHFLRTVCIYMTRQLNEKEVLPYQACFNFQDKNEDGLLSLEEFAKAGAEFGGISKDVLVNIFQALDIHQNKQQTYTQFVSGGLPTSFFIKEDVVAVVFRFFDHDKDGILTKKDLNNFINYEYPGMLETAYGKKMLLEFNAFSGDGIRYQQFLGMLKTMVKV